MVSTSCSERLFGRVIEPARDNRPPALPPLLSRLFWNLDLINDTHAFHDALKRGVAPGGNLREEMRQLGEYLLTTYFDAGVLIDVMRDFVEKPALGGDADPDYRELVGLYQSVLETDAFHQLTRRGIPLLMVTNVGRHAPIGPDPSAPFVPSSG